MEVRIEKYNPENKKEWDAFVSSSKNGTFLFYRDFMEYHSDRFLDFSLLFYVKSKLVALLPSNIKDNTLYSHQGLTYGGLILSELVTVSMVLCIFGSLKKYLKDNQVFSLFYKTVPHIYHKLSSEEDLYALFRNDARLVGRSISTCICKDSRVKYSELRRRGVKKAQKESLSVKESDDFSFFWQILEDNLQNRYGVAPVHTLSEINYLKNIFPDSTRLFEVYNSDQLLAGCVIFETNRVAHVQYISASSEGKKLGALDYLFDYLIQKLYINKPFFEFGISTEDNGNILNEGLISQKEGFGGRAVVYDLYELKI